MGKLLFTIKDKTSLRDTMQTVWENVCQGIKAGPVVVELGRVNKSREQEKRYHAMIGDIAKQIDFDGKKFSVEVWKAKLVDQFEEEYRAMGKTLSTPGFCVVSLDGRRAVQVRPSTTRFKSAEASDFIEYLFSFGAGESIEWSDPETQSLYRAYWEKTCGQN